MRAMGDILLEMEELLDEMVDDHDLQWGDIRSLVMQHLKTHRPDAQEEYEEGGSPLDYYGPEECLNGYGASKLLFQLVQEYKVGRPRKHWSDLMEKADKFFKEEGFYV